MNSTWCINRARTGCHLDDGPAPGAPGLVVVQGRAGLGHSHPAPDHRTDLARGGQLSRSPWTWSASSRPKGLNPKRRIPGSTESDPGEHHSYDVDVSDAGHPQGPTGHPVLVVVGEPNGQVPAAPGGAPPRPLDYLTPGQVVDDVGAHIFGGDQNGLDEVLGRVVDDHVGSERPAQIDLVLPAGHGDDPGTGRLAQLDAGRAQPLAPA